MNAMQNIMLAAPLLAATLLVVGLFVAEILSDITKIFTGENAMHSSFEISFQSAPSSTTADRLAWASAQCVHVMLVELDRSVQMHDRSIAIAAIDGALAMRLLSADAEANAIALREDLLSRGHLWPLAILPC